MNKWRLSLLFLTVAISLVLTAGCSSNDPHEEIKEFIKQAESAVESGNMRKARSMIADSYTDEDSRTKKDIASYLSYQLLRQKSVFLFTSVESIAMESETEAKASVFVAMTGRPVDDASLLPQVRGDIYLFEFTIIKDGDSWMLQEATWQPALVEDIFTGSP